MADIERVAGKYLLAVKEAGRIYRHIAERKPDFIAEVSMDETDAPQTPPELLVILAALADADRVVLLVLRVERESADGEGGRDEQECERLHVGFLRRRAPRARSPEDTAG